MFKNFADNLGLSSAIYNSTTKNLLSCSFLDDLPILCTLTEMNRLTKPYIIEKDFVESGVQLYYKTIGKTISYD